MKEEWRDIAGYEGKYQVSNLGRVKSLNYKRTGKHKILKLLKGSDGYFYIGLCKNGIKKNNLVHRLIAQSFIENPDDFPEVNHRDENKQNNKVSNLEWCTHQYNNTYLSKHRKISKKVACYKDGKLIKVYDAIIDVKKDGFNDGQVCQCCKGNRKSHHGFQWKYI